METETKVLMAQLKVERIKKAAELMKMLKWGNWKAGPDSILWIAGILSLGQFIVKQDVWALMMVWLCSSAAVKIVHDRQIKDLIELLGEEQILESYKNR